MKICYNSNVLQDQTACNPQRSARFRLNPDREDETERRITVMAGNKNTKYDGMSASKAKRERAKDEREQVKRAATRNKAIGIGIIVLIAALIGAVYQEPDQVTTYTRVEVDGWLKDYNFSASGNRVVLLGYGGEEEEHLTVHGSAEIIGNQYDEIEFTNFIGTGYYYNLSQSLTEVTFEKGVILSEDSSNLLKGCKKLTTVDMSEADVSEVVNMDDMFAGCESLATIMTPKNLTCDAGLTGTFTDESGNVYTSLPQNLSESITITKTTAYQSDWLRAQEIINMGMAVITGKGIAQSSERELRKLKISSRNKIEIFALDQNPQKNLFYALKLKDAFEEMKVSPAKTSLTLAGTEEIIASMLQVSKDEYGFGYVNVFEASELMARAMIRLCPPWECVSFDESGRAVQDFDCIVVGLGECGQAVLDPQMPGMHGVLQDS